jgi:hypothetical protein
MPQASPWGTSVEVGGTTVGGKSDGTPKRARRQSNGRCIHKRAWATRCYRTSATSTITSGRPRLDRILVSRRVGLLDLRYSCAAPLCSRLAASSGSDWPQARLLYPRRRSLHSPGSGVATKTFAMRPSESALVINAFTPTNGPASATPGTWTGGSMGTAGAERLRRCVTSSSAGTHQRT